VAKNTFPTQRTKIFSLIYCISFVALGVLYYTLTLINKPDPAVLKKYSLSLASFHWLQASILIILTIIWTASLMGSLFFKLYAVKIRDSSDGNALNIISNGLIVLSIAQPITSNLGLIAGLIGKHHPEHIPKLTIANNYISLALMGLAMALVAIGGQKLISHVGRRLRITSQNWWVMAFIAFSALYSYFIIIQPIHTPLSRRAYFLPDWLLVVSIAIPYLCVWYLGLNGASQIYHYQKNIRGLLYKSALKYLAAGITAVIATSVFTRVIITSSTRLSHFQLTPMLLIIYALLLIDAIGFILIAIGARRLGKIEEA
jgi:hypothetical protein